MSTSYDSIKIYKFLLNHIHKLHTFYLMVFYTNITDKQKASTVSRWQVKDFQLV